MVRQRHVRSIRESINLIGIFFLSLVLLSACKPPAPLDPIAELIATGRDLFFNKLILPIRMLPIGSTAVISLFMSLPAQPDRVVVGPKPQKVEETFVEAPEGIEVEVWVEYLHVPWSLRFLPNGDALIAERRGRIMRVPQGSDRPEVYLEIEVNAFGDGGLMGLATHPDFAKKPFLYLMHGYGTSRENRKNRVSRFRHLGETAEFDRVILNEIPGSKYHEGGRIGFGPDGMLYVGTGDVGEPTLAQDLKSMAGKILRLTPEGEFPDDNPFPGSPVYSYGHRVVQGMTWDPESKMMFDSEHGPSGMAKELYVQHSDEINIIEKGSNHGWPRVINAPGLPEYVDPIVSWPKQSVPPGGMTFYRGDLYVATLGSQALVRIRFSKEGNRYKVKAIERLFARGPREGVYGRLRDVQVGPDGHLYVTTSNTDGRARLRARDDKILRLKFQP